MYFLNLFKAPFSKHLYFLTALDSFFCNVVSNDVKSRWLLSACSKTFVKFCVVLSNACILYLIFYKFRWFGNMVVMFILCLCCTYGGFSSKENPKNSWRNCCLLRVREDWKFLENTQNGRLCMTLES